MTASVPADLQISLGRLSTEAGSGNGLVNSLGTLVPGVANNIANPTGTADNGGVADPGDTAEYWSNTADISAYYSLGRIMPASSVDGKALYFTPDASGVGKTLKSNAKYFTAVNGAAIEKDSNGNSYMTTLHAYKAKSGATPSDNWTSVKAKEYNVTNDDGYFVDIPVWIRTSSTDADIPLSIDAYVTTKNKTDDDDLYLAARAVILGAERTTTSGLIEIREGSYLGDTSIVDFMSSTNSTGAAVASLGAAYDDSDASKGAPANYGLETYYDGTTANSGIVIQKSVKEGEYGTPTKVWIRVWLEGEDSNCWNENAGQDFNISLKFSRDDVELPENTFHYNQSANAEGQSGSLVAGTKTHVLDTTNHVWFEFTYNGATWQLTGIDSTAGNGTAVVPTGTFPAAPAGQYYTIDGNQEVTYDTIVAYLNDKSIIGNKTQANTGVTMTTINTTPVTQVTCTVTKNTADPTQCNVTYNPITSGFTDIESIYINGVNYGSTFPDRIDTSGWTWGDTETTRNIAVDITYAADAPTYAVSYETINVAGGDALTLMRVDTITKTTSGDPATTSLAHSYKWYIAAANAYKIPTGANVTSSVAATMQATKLTDILTVLNSVTTNNSAATALGTLTQNAVPQYDHYAVTVQGDPSAQQIYLTRTINAGTTSWGLATDATYMNGKTQYVLTTGGKLKLGDNEYETTEALNTALGNYDSNNTPVISYVAP
jgi:hypothetical protein